MKTLFVSLLFIFTMQSVFADIMCDDASTDYYAIYVPKTYTCNSGYYLPANTDGCVACPSGFTCAGGTFSFNETIYQGAEINFIGTSTMNNVCADNFPIDLYAVYEPKTVTLNYDDDNGHTVASSCTYDETINLPPDPTRAGYTFRGWILDPNN